MSQLRTTGAMQWSNFQIAAQDDRCQAPHYSSTWQRCGPDALWDRSGLLSSGGAGFWGTLASAGDVWDWSVWNAVEPKAGQRRETISGVTRDINGNALAGVTVRLFRALTHELVDVVTSDSNGNYKASTSYAGEQVYAEAVNTGNTLSGATTALTPT